MDDVKPLELHYRECGDRVPNTPCVCAEITARSTVTHPLATIRFEWISDPVLTQLRIIRHWYHVPRMGDFVELTYQATGAEPVKVSGVVKIVMWSEDHVTVRLR